MKEMTDAQTAAHLRQWVATSPHDVFSWPTDGCGYEQHMRFVKHRNENWRGGKNYVPNIIGLAQGLKPQRGGPDDSFNRFVLDYADSLEGIRTPAADSMAVQEEDDGA